MSNRSKLRIVAVLAAVAIIVIYLGHRGFELQVAKDKTHAQTQLTAPPHPGSERLLDRDFKAAMERESAVVSNGSLATP